MTDKMFKYFQVCVSLGNISKCENVNEVSEVVKLTRAATDSASSCPPVFVNHRTPAISCYPQSQL